MRHIKAIIGLSSLLAMMVGIAVGQQEPTLLDLRSIEVSPAPAGELHPQLQWMATEKVRAIWIGDDLFDESPGTDKTKAEVLAEAGFNLVRVSMGVDPNNPDTSPDITDRLPANLAEAHRVGLPLLIGWKYGTHHQEPYRRYRGLDGVLAEKSCCPLDTEYIGRHIGRWAVALAEGGADGMGIDTEMYGSDTGGGYYAGPCVCDDCFANYLMTYATGDSQSLYDSTAPDERGTWLASQGGDDDITYWWAGVGSLRGVTAHYARYQAQRIAAQYDQIRAQCQQINPLFLFGHAPSWNHLPGLEKGLGTPAVPCLVFSEYEYVDGPYNNSYRTSDWIRDAGVSALFLPGAWVRVQSPKTLCNNALLSSLYCDGWWIWYGTALLTRPDVLEKAAGPSGPYSEPYGRYGGTTAWDYLDRIAMTHRQLERLLTRPRESWPLAEHLLPRPGAEVAWCQGVVTIDGILDESAWEQATPLNVVANTGGQGAPPTEVLLCWDDEALYVAARCGLPSGVTLQAPPRSRDDPELQRDEGIQVFLDPGRTGQRYAHFVISASGQVYDSLNTVVGEGTIHSSTGWNVNATTAVTAGEGEYVLEARLPFREIAPVPQPGEVWEANFARVQPVEAVWSHTTGGVHVPARFGRITFQGE